MARDWYKPFLKALSEEPNVSRACKEARVPRSTAYHAREEDAKFRQAWDEAIDDGVDVLEQEARRRALTGSDTLMIFLLKAYRRERFGDKATIDLNVSDLREAAIAKARELGLSEQDAIETADDIEKRMKAGTL